MLWVHGGPVGAVGWEFPSAMTAALVDAGYAVLMPNPRGSIGRGRDFAAFVVGDMGGEESHDLLSGLDHLVSLGIADPARLAVGGVSYGGYMAALLPAVDDRFAAAVVGSPLTDLISSHYGSSLSVFVRDYVGGRPTDQVQRYLDRSPVFAGSRLRTPTLLVTGLRDRATPVGQARRDVPGPPGAGRPDGARRLPRGGARGPRLSRPHRLDRARRDVARAARPGHLSLPPR